MKETQDEQLHAVPLSAWRPLVLLPGAGHMACSADKAARFESATPPQTVPSVTPVAVVTPRWEAEESALAEYRNGLVGPRFCYNAAASP